jgi:drug/metabolite transporter (DMT)-like permease
MSTAADADAAPTRRRGGAVRTWLAGLSPARRGAVIFIVSGLVFTATDALTKSLVSNVPVVDVIWGRHVAYLVAVIAIAGRGRPRRLLVSSRKRTQVARGLAMFGATATFFLSLSLLPLAEVSTLASTTPLIILGLAGPLLGERVSRPAVAGALIGFAGVVVLVGIDPTTFNLATLVPLATATSYALFSLLTRALSTEGPDVTLFYSGLVSMAAATVLFAIAPRDPLPEPWQWAGIGVVGLSALTGHRLLVGAYRWGRASDLAPLGYLSLVWSFAIGAIVFGEPAQPQAIVGAIAISIGGLLALRSAPPDREVPVSVDFGDPVDLGGPAGAETDVAAERISRG